MMQKFDEKIWLEKASKRCSTFKDHEKAAEALQRDIIAIKHLKVIESWCDDHDVNLTFSPVRDGTYHSNRIKKAKKSKKSKARIEVNIKASCEHQVLMILHEIGHHIIQMNDLSKTKWASKGYAQGKFDKDHSMHYKIDVLEEEYLAWDHALNLANELNLQIDTSRFNKYKVASLKTYVLWAAGTISS